MLAVLPSRIVASCNDKKLAVYEVTGKGSVVTVQMAAILDQHREAVQCMHRVDDSTFATGSLDGAIILWSSTKLSVLFVLNYKETYQSPSTKMYTFSIHHLITMQNFLVPSPDG